MEEILNIDGGDGDRRFLGERLQLKSVDEPWFPSEIAGREAHLFRAVGGRWHGEYFALTSRLTASLLEQIRDMNGASVVLHKIWNPGPTFDPNNPKDEYAAGMAWAEVDR